MIEYLNDFEAFCLDNDILIHYVSDMNTTIRGYCYYDGQYFNIILNNKYCSTQIKKTTIHEIIHVMENHFKCSPEKIENCEEEVRYIMNKLKLNLL